MKIVGCDLQRNSGTDGTFPATSLNRTPKRSAGQRGLHSSFVSAALSWATRLPCHCQIIDFTSTKGSRKSSAMEYPYSMAENLVALAQKMAEAARAGVAIEKKRLQEILLERQKKSASSSSSSK